MSELREHTHFTKDIVLDRAPYEGENIYPVDGLVEQVRALNSEILRIRGAAPPHKEQERIAEELIRLDAANGNHLERLHVIEHLLGIAATDGGPISTELERVDARFRQHVGRGVHHQHIEGREPLPDIPDDQPGASAIRQLDIRTNRLVRDLDALLDALGMEPTKVVDGEVLGGPQRIVGGIAGMWETLYGRLTKVENGVVVQEGIDGQQEQINNLTATVRDLYRGLAAVISHLQRVHTSWGEHDNEHPYTPREEWREGSPLADLAERVGTIEAEYATTDHTHEPRMEETSPLNEEAAVPEPVNARMRAIGAVGEYLSACGLADPMAKVVDVRVSSYANTVSFGVDYENPDTVNMRIRGAEIPPDGRTLPSVREHVVGLVREYLIGIGLLHQHGWLTDDSVRTFGRMVTFTLDFAELPNVRDRQSAGEKES